MEILYTFMRTIRIEKALLHKTQLLTLCMSFLIYLRIPNVE